MSPPRLPLASPLSTTVYSVVWPATEALVRRCLSEEIDAMLNAHRDAQLKHQDPLHEGFFQAWQRFAASAVQWEPAQFPETYPTNGSSEAIREIIHEAAWKDEDLVVFDGDYEGYEAIAAGQNTTVHRVNRDQWREVMRDWSEGKAPWGHRKVQWWVSQPSAIDGNAWPEFQDWLQATDLFRTRGRIWIDLTYVGRARLSQPIDLQFRPAVAGFVFSLSKVMGAYYRRIGGCWSRDTLPSLWGNRWFKNLDSLYLGQRWLEEAGDALAEGQRYASEQQQAMAEALEALGGSRWAEAGLEWKASDVPMLMHAANPDLEAPEDLALVWEAGRRGTLSTVSRRLCLTPTLTRVVGAPAYVPPTPQT